jgi:hypothetical protein
VDFDNLAIFIKPIEVGQMVNDRLQTFGRGNVEGLIVADMRIDYPALRCAANFIQALKEFSCIPGFGPPTK